MLECPLGLLRNVNLSFLEPLDQIGGREIDQLDGIGAIEDSIWHRLAHPDVGNLRDDVIEAFDVLNIDRGVNVDAVTHQFFGIKIALGMAAAFGVGVSEFVDQDDLRMARDNRVQVNFGEQLPFVLHLSAWNDFQAAQQRFSLLAAVGLDNTNDNIIAVLLARLGLLLRPPILASSSPAKSTNGRK